MPRVGLTICDQDEIIRHKYWYRGVYAPIWTTYLRYERTLTLSGINYIKPGKPGLIARFQRYVVVIIYWGKFLFTIFEQSKTSTIDFALTQQTLKLIRYPREKFKR